ncbi:Lpg0189 family type II secretion system effector [uncultured Legionella sp.]|uniref:Lpg0189 family type II secretion system effector n=1 Tax=uncultured Legionella sp. TaxID=210934 RepID=UPI00260A96F5|nr:Lpg0189 family type II secretion system effector [uncultured Legionella sp.]
MRLNYFIAPLALFPLCSFGQTEHLNNLSQLSKNPVTENTIEKSYSSSSEGLNHLQLFTRNTDYPTQIIRTSSAMKGQELTCEQVNEVIEEKIIRYITSDKFAYQTYIQCTFNPDTHYATQFQITSYFDPVNDDAINYLKAYLSANNGSDFLGTKLNIESAKGLIVTINISAGMKKNPKKPPFIEYKQDRRSFFFKNNYEMNKVLFTDIYQNFYSNEPNKILPFLDRWLFAHAGTLYKAVLRDSNFAELQPEQIFLMEDGEKIFVSGLKYHFAHNCSQYDNHRCLISGI